jgi:hypothetical protein
MICTRLLPCAMMLFPFSIILKKKQDIHFCKTYYNNIKKFIFIRPTTSIINFVKSFLVFFFGALRSIWYPTLCFYVLEPIPCLHLSVQELDLVSTTIYLLNYWLVWLFFHIRNWLFLIFPFLHYLHRSLYGLFHCVYNVVWDIDIFLVSFCVRFYIN